MNEEEKKRGKREERLGKKGGRWGGAAVIVGELQW